MGNKTNIHNKPSKEFEEAFILEYLNNESINLAQLSKKFNIGNSSGYRIVKRNNIEIQDRSAFNTRKYDINHFAFSQLTNDCAYWVGMLMADGCLVDSTIPSNIISLKLSSKDVNHLYKMKNFISSDVPLYELKNVNEHMLAFSNKTITNDLKKYGLIHRKSAKEKANEILIPNRDFWRGCIDGDGTVSVSKCGKNKFYPYISLNGSLDLCSQFSEFLFPLLNQYYKPFITNKNSFKNHLMYRTSVQGKNAIKLAYLLYDNCNYYLDRKKQVANMILEHYNYNP